MTDTPGTSTAPIFVVGPPRSGTTLTSNILGRHSRIFTCGENHFFEDIYARRKELGDPGDAAARGRILDRLLTIYGRYNQKDDQQRVERLLAEPELLLRLQRATTYSELLSGFMGIQCQRSGKARWGNNTPKDIFHIAEILSFYPDACVLVCVRDVRDFLLSYKGRWRTTSPDHRERFQKLYHPMVTSLLWKSTMRRIPSVRAAVPERRLMIVHYEELVTAPEAVVRRMCDVVGERFEADMLNVDTHNSSEATKGPGIFSSSVGAWRTGLDPEEALVALQVNRKELRERGYPLDPPRRARSWRVVCLYLSFPAALLRALRANAGMRGPLLPYLYKRFLALVGLS